MSERSIIDDAFEGNPSQPIRLVLGALATTFFVCWAVQVWGAIKAERHSVTGQVTFNGWPLKGALVTLHPTADARVRADVSGLTEADGRFRLASLGLCDGAIVGRYGVTVEWRPPAVDGETFVAGPNLLPARYASPRTTPLRVEVSQGHNDLDIQLTVRDGASVVSLARDSLVAN